MFRWVFRPSVPSERLRSVSIPEVRYVRSGDVHIAYQVLGEGPDLVITPGGWNHLLLRWELPVNARLLRRLAGFSRLILWDKRGTGLSDRHGGMPTLSAQLDDLLAVLNEIGSERAAHFGLADGAALTALFAATHPGRTSTAILYAILPRVLPGEDGLGVARDFLQAIQEGASPERMLAFIAPGAAADPTVREWWQRNQLMSVSPGTLEQLVGMWMQVDLRSILPALRVPTTIIQRTDDLVIPPPNGREAARLVPNARYVELPGDFATFSGDVDALGDEIEEAVTGERHRPEGDRMLATILFTDIVGSTEAAARLGDASWRQLLDEHDAVVARQIETLGGRLVKSLGDGVLATFDSPGRALRCGAGIVENLAARGIQVRAGVHTGECERRGEDVGGIAVHIAARVGALAGPGELLATGTVRDLVFGSEMVFEDRGVQKLRGVPGAWPVLSLVS